MPLDSIEPVGSCIRGTLLNFARSLIIFRARQELSRLSRKKPLDVSFSKVRPNSVGIFGCRNPTVRRAAAGG
jgi:hypothetical protein